jgi:hypothetical protein
VAPSSLSSFFRLDPHWRQAAKTAAQEEFA